jgi:hypothetical protein
MRPRNVVDITEDHSNNNSLRCTYLDDCYPVAIVQALREESGSRGEKTIMARFHSRNVRGE